MNESNESNEEKGIYEDEIPLVGYVLNSNNSQLKIFSVKNEKTKHVLRFGSKILKFQTNFESESNKMLILL